MPTIERTDDGDFDVVCERCGLATRMHPGESVVPQLELFIAQHSCDLPHPREPPPQE